MKLVACGTPFLSILVQMHFGHSDLLMTVSEDTPPYGQTLKASLGRHCPTTSPVLSSRRPFHAYLHRLPQQQQQASTAQSLSRHRASIRSRILTFHGVLRQRFANTHLTKLIL